MTGNPQEPVWRRVAFMARWVTDSLQHPHGNLWQDESLLFPDVLKEMELNNFDRGICCERHVKRWWVIFCLLPCPHCLVPSDLSIALCASWQKLCPLPIKIPLGCLSSQRPRSPLWVFPLKLTYWASGNAGWHQKQVWFLSLSFLPIPTPFL